MADLPRRRPELPLKGSAILLLLLLLAGSLSAQEEGRGPGRGGASLEADLLLTRVADDGIWMGGGLAQVRIAPRVYVGGGGWLALEPAPLAASGEGLDLELGLGYGGLLLSTSLGLPSTSMTLLARMLLGAGNADVRERATGILLGSDNFAVAEPALLLAIPLAGRLTVLTGGSWRAAFGVEDLPGVRAGGISGATFVTAFRIGAL